VKNTGGRFDTWIDTRPRIAIALDTPITFDGQCAERAFTHGDCVEKKGGEVIVCF
jgi:hypothetical protein